MHLIKTIADQAVSQAVRIKEHYLEPLNASAAINAFQWCKAKLTLEHPEALETCRALRSGLQVLPKLRNRLMHPRSLGRQHLVCCKTGPPPGSAGSCS